ncbi:hypothetical protein [Bradyrhizobium sp. LTSPM299]|uniref:hypothetical protein n=1 Tax=Bradyrhizobium sp. LTSPM299 TaxID=1619233 RepID=UPI0012E26E7F|nr:hypothetical protein [Bradyrhizobium sp. LTSPM299]
MSISRTLRVLFAIGAISLIATTVSNAAPPEDSGFAIYSDVCYHPAEGDLLGTRVVLLRLKDADYVVYQMAEGELGKPQIGTATVDPKKGDILFKVAAGDSNEPVATFRGKIAAQALTGSFDNSNWTNRKGEKTFRLPRIVGRQQSYPVCD